MLTEFEARLADVLGARLPTPFGGRVRRRGVPAPAGNGPVVRLGVETFEPIEPDFGSVRPEAVPGAAGRRRVLRLGVTVGIEVIPQTDGDRAQQLLGIDALVYELQDPDMRSAALLVQPQDQGFVLEGLELATSYLTGDAIVLARGEGWFWPVGTPATQGREISRALVREFRLPVHLELAAPPVAGGGDVALAVTFGATGTLVVDREGTTSAPFGMIAVRLTDDGGGAGAGTLTGGEAGPDGTRVVAVSDGTASVSYAPPAQAAVDRLVVSAFTRDTDGGTHIGVELARFDLAVVS